jgi:hypothetical protein
MLRQGSVASKLLGPDIVVSSRSAAYALATARLSYSQLHPVKLTQLSASCPMLSLIGTGVLSKSTNGPLEEFAQREEIVGETMRIQEETEL